MCCMIILHLSDISRSMELSDSNCNNIGRHLFLVLYYINLTQEASRARRSPGGPGGARRSQEEPGGTGRNQEEPGGARRNQEEPGGARGSQEEPGGARARRPRLRGGATGGLPEN